MEGLLSMGPTRLVHNIIPKSMFRTRFLMYNIIMIISMMMMIRVRMIMIMIRRMLRRSRRRRTTLL